MFPEMVIPIDREGYPEGYRHDWDLTPMIKEERQRLTDRLFRGVGKISFYNFLAVLLLSFAVFWIRLSYLWTNNYYQIGQPLGSMMGYRKTDYLVANVYQEWNNDADTFVAFMFMSRDLAGVFITALDQCCLYGILLVNLYILQYNWNKFTLFLNIILFLKDITVIVAWADEEEGSPWSWHPGIWNWGFMFLRRPLGLPITLALLNIFLIRIPYFILATSNSDSDIDSESDLYAEPPQEPGFFMQYIGFPITRWGKALLMVYLFALFCLLIANFFAGLVLMVLGMFGFFALYLFLFITLYTIPYINAKFAIRNK